MPGKHSLFWKLVTLLVGFCLLMIWLSLSWGRYAETQNAFLSREARTALGAYAGEAEQAWTRGGEPALDAWLAGMGAREKAFVGVIGRDLQALGSVPLSDAQTQRLTFLRGLDWPVSRHSTTPPWLKIPFPNDPSLGALVMQLPERFQPGRYALVWHILITGLVPGLFTVLLCVGLYRMLIAPLNQLREQANAWRADQLHKRLSRQTVSRPDELGELGRAFDHMAERLQSTVALQQQLLRDLSHELRTPLSRLRVACDSEQELGGLRARLAREVDGMQRLVEDTLQLAWLDAERTPQAQEAIQVQALWEMVAEDARFESAWPAHQLECAVPADCWVQGNLNSLAQAMENILRNAIRHSPPGGRVSLQGRRTGSTWHLWLEDEGGGVAEADLERIFDPFIRLDGSRPGHGGFGLGLSIARNAVAHQGGRLWAQNGGNGLRLNLLLNAAYS
ncbi:MAG: histidine kinase sensor domain-containing protein [Pseudomonas sp.]|nr:histidine kinase sensor domain-containing protein [Pseudomonas sp.]